MKIDTNELGHLAAMSTNGKNLKKSSSSEAIDR